MKRAMVVLLMLLCGCATQKPPFRVTGVLEIGSDWPGGSCGGVDVVAGRGGEAYLAEGGACCRIDPVNDAVVWQTELSTNAFGCDLALAGDTLLVRPGNSCLAALDVRSGACRWRVHTPAYATGLAVAGDVVYAQSDTNELAGYALADGRKVWSMKLPWELDNGRDDVTLYGVADGTLVCHPFSDRSRVVGLDLASKSVRWRTPVGDAGTVCGLGGTLYMLRGSNLVCRSAATGATRWERTLDARRKRAVGFATMSVDGQGVFVACWPDVWRVSAEGERLWHWENRALMPDIIRALPQGRLLILARSRLYALEPGDPAESDPVSPDERLALLRRIMAKSDNLSWEELWQLDRMRAEAVPVIIEECGRLLDKRPALSEQEDERLNACRDLIERYADVSAADQLEKVLSRQKASIAYELRLLWDLGAQEAAVRTYINRLRREPAGTEEGHELIEIGRHYLTADCPEATGYLADVLEKRQPRELLDLAYENGARNGTARQVAQVLALRREPVPFTGDALPEWLAKKLGVTDVKAHNPLAPKRTDLTEEERVLQAVFDARFRFTGASELCVVTLPKGWRPLAFTGREGCTLCFVGCVDPVVEHGLKNHKVAHVTFGYGKEDPLIQWNGDRSEATVTVQTWYGPLAATGYVVRVRKIGGEWVPVYCSMSWIS